MYIGVTRAKTKSSHHTRYSLRKLLLLTFFCVTVAGAHADDKGLLIIQVVGATGSSGSTLERFSAYRLMNLETQKVSIVHFTNRVAALELQEGIYCVYSVSLAQNHEAVACDEPYFKVVAGNINNAGWWKISFGRRIQLVDATH